MIKFLVGDIESGGFGAMFARRKLIMQIAEAFNRVPIFRYTSYEYNDPFKPLPYTLQTLKELKLNTAKKFEFKHTDDDVVFFDFNTYWPSSYRNVYQTWHPENISYLMYSGKLYNELKLNALFQEHVEKILLKLKSKWEINSFENVIGLHFRRGDKITEGSNVYKYQDKNYFINFIREKYDLTKNKVFITSDDNDFIKETVKGFSNINFIWDEDEQRYGNNTISNAELVKTNPNLKFQETLTFIKNVEILKQCKCVVGGYNVQMTKISGSINSYLKNKDVLFLINPVTNELDTMGSSEFTS